MDNLTGERGYTEENVAELLRNERFVAAVHAYSQDRLTLVQASLWAASRDLLAPDPFEFNPAGYYRLIHEVARRMRAGAVSIPPDLHDKYPEIYVGEYPENYEPARFVWHKYPPFRMKFSELEAIPAQTNPLAARRRVFTEEDIQELSKNMMFLACVDAYRLVLIDLVILLRRAFGDDVYPPRLLSYEGFSRLALEVAGRISRGEIALPPSFKTTYASAYVPELGQDH